MNIKLRVPLFSYIKYKGVEFLVEAKCNELHQTLEIDSQLYNEISNEMALL
jgi:hypothetical protein